MTSDTQLRIGQGYDLHRIVPDRPLFLGGVQISTPGWGLLGHSDADVLLHAVTDAVLGAVAAGDIGQWFSDHDLRWKNCRSTLLLRHVLDAPELSGWRLINLDCTVIAQRPQLAPHRDDIRASLATLLGCPHTAISVKAKTNEGVDAIGREEAIAAWAVVLMQKS